jgi:VanZ family protein
MSIFFSILSILYIAGIFLFADSPMVSDVAPFNPFSLLHIPLYGILTILLVLSFRRKPSNPINPTNSINPLIAGLIALVVAIADEIHQAYVPGRDASVTDVFLDIVGISICLLLIKRIGQISGFSKIPKFLRRIP